MSAPSPVHSSAVRYTYTVLLETLSGTLLDDVSDTFLAERSSITRDTSNIVPGVAKFVFSADHSFYKNRLRVSVLVEGGGDTATYPLGVWVPDVSSRLFGSIPEIWEVEGFDPVIVLHTPHGATVEVPAGTSILATVESLISPAGFPVSIDQTAASVTASQDLIWPLVDEPTTLEIVNDLLEMVGYEKLYTSPSGAFTSRPRQTIASTSPVWSYFTTEEHPIVDDRITVGSNLYDVPNRWIFVRQSTDPSLPAPTIGDGIYEVINQSDGITSVDARGRTITRVYTLDVADHTTLVALGNAIVEEDRMIEQEIEIETVPNPVHWHRDVVELTAPSAGFSSVKTREISWSFDLGRGKMFHRLRRIV